MKEEAFVTIGVEFDQDEGQSVTIRGFDSDLVTWSMLVDSNSDDIVRQELSIAMKRIQIRIQAAAELQSLSSNPDGLHVV